MPQPHTHALSHPLLYCPLDVRYRKLIRKSTRPNGQLVHDLVAWVKTLGVRVAIVHQAANGAVDTDVIGPEGATLAGGLLVHNGHMQYLHPTVADKLSSWRIGTPINDLNPTVKC